MAGRKVFTSGEILTAADVNSFLMDQSVMVFADSTARSSAIPTPTEGMVTYREDANRVEVYDGSAFGAIGGILQVVSTTKTDSFTTTSTSLVDITSFSVAITPSSASSKIWVIANLSVGVQNTAGVGAYLTLLRNSTSIAIGDSAGSRQRVTTDSSGATAQVINGVGLNFLDAPATTSALTYKVQMRSQVGETRAINRSVQDADTGAFARAVSTITVMEVAG